MRKHIILRTAAVSLLTVVLSLTSLPAEATGPRDRIDTQIRFLASKQLDDGAILTFDDRINPYFANIASLGLLSTKRHEAKDIVLKWMGWYLNHLEIPDASGLTGTVYDWAYDPATGAQTPTKDYDSVDSYASTSLNLAYRAYLSDDHRLRQFVRDNIGDYDRIAALLINSTAAGGVREANGLTIAKPSYPAMYTMDNAEVYSGLMDYSRLKRLLRTSDWRTYRNAAKDTRRAMLEHLWDANTQTWHWAVGSPSDPSASFYPQAAAQIWPILFGVVKPWDPIARKNWKTFTTAWPGWVDDDIPDSFPWTSMAVVANRMFHGRDARALIRAIENKYAPGWNQPTHCSVSVCGRWYSAEAGWMLLALTRSHP